MLGRDVLTGLPTQAQQLQVPSVDYGAIAPMLVVLGAACVSVLVEAFVARSARWSAQVALTLLTLGAAGAALGMHLYSNGVSNVVTLAGTVAVDGPALFLWGTLLA
ncbi:MAG: NADH-quinone oxidoreductase subunit NuoN, partial [Pseudonocardiaceae bacterium]